MNGLFTRRGLGLSLTISILCLLVCQFAIAAPQTIVPGVKWYDTSGNVISAHGAGMIKVGSTYYWIGEYKDNEYWMKSGMGHVTAPFIAITCYSSTDLTHWTFVGNLLTQQPSGDLGPNRVVERPKVIYNAATGRYVMYMHIDNATYRDARVGVASCATLTGSYTYHGSFKPLGNDSRDMTLYKDADGTGYLISGDNLKIYRLAADYLSVESQVGNIVSSGAYEAPAIFFHNGLYYCLASQKTWWAANDNRYWTAPALTGPWTYRGDFTPGSSNTWQSQTTFVQPVEGSVTTTCLYMGDRWVEGQFGESTYIWLPLQISGTSVTLDWYDRWAIDTATGEWSAGGGGDTETPTAPANLAATAVSSSQIDLTWTASTDNVGVTGYKVFRGGVEIDTVAGTTYQDTGLTPNTTYSYYVKAFDAAGNVSPQSNTAQATTQTGGGANLALGMATAVSSAHTAANGGDKAVDGYTDTWWRTLKKSSLPAEWIVVDLGASYTVDTVTLKWGSYYARTYQIQVSPDGETWTTVYSTTAGNGATDEISFAAVSARYVRMYSTAWSNATERCYLQEFEIYQLSGPDRSIRRRSFGR
ncbi:MAG: discoidin domain-containing protein [Patescibacteria group bacterium]